MVPTMCRRHLDTVPQGQTWIRGVVLDNGRWMRTVETRKTVIVMSYTIDTIYGRTTTRISFLITFFRSGVPVFCHNNIIHNIP